jgi:hypothetical protein
MSFADHNDPALFKARAAAFALGLVATVATLAGGWSAGWF